MTGTNMLIRKSALDKIGGFDESTLTEDVRTSLLFHQGGWEGIYVNKTVAVGYPPPDIASYHRQQRRWAIGTFQNFFDKKLTGFSTKFLYTFFKFVLYLRFRRARERRNNGLITQTARGHTQMQLQCLTQLLIDSQDRVK